MRVTVEMAGLQDVLEGTLARIERGTTDAMKEAAAGLKEDLREQVRDAGLGDRLAKTWQATVYPQGGASLSPAAFVKSKAPKVISFFEQGQAVTAVHGRFLAIPTDDTPRKRGGRAMSVDEVQAMFGKRLRLVDPYGQRGMVTPSIRRKAIYWLVVDDLVVRKSSQRWRRRGPVDTKRGRQGQSVIMFTLVPVVKGQKRLDLRAAAQAWASRVPGLIERNIAE